LTPNGTEFYFNLAITTQARSWANTCLLWMMTLPCVIP
jgi:hypothetical protein